MSRQDGKVEQVLAELWWFSIELGEQTTKSNGVPELFMATISPFLSFLSNSFILEKKGLQHTFSGPNMYDIFHA